MERAYQICTRCIMDITDPEITFDENGACNHCTEYYERRPQLVPEGEAQKARLNELVAEMKEKGKGKDYDCIIGISGGVDSSYMAYKVKELGIRALAVHFDNGWNSELAVKNIENIVKKLGFDYQTYVVDWEEFKDVQLAFFRASIANIEAPSDHAFLAAIFQLCNKYGIKYVLTGSNYNTEGILPKSWGYSARDLTPIKAIHKQFGTMPMKTYPRLGYGAEIYYNMIKRIKFVRLLHYIPYVKAEAMDVLENKLDWQYYGGKHYESVFTRFFQGYILPKKFKIDKRRAHLSTLICNNDFSREEALEEMKKETYPPEMLKQDKEYVFKKWGLTKEEFQEIMDKPIKSYRDYPNQEKFFKLLYSVYSKIRKI
ncbi:MAG: N-acetyl sugar amidotransferase [Flavobacteriales bacterium]|nr:MAG: N-acetyl sugar amidotransferase [Flavobacteriales bacterium]